jgi:hypothetical protein
MFCDVASAKPAMPTCANEAEQGAALPARPRLRPRPEGSPPAGPGPTRCTPRPSSHVGSMSARHCSPHPTCEPGRCVARPPLWTCACGCRIAERVTEWVWAERYLSMKDEATDTGVSDFFSPSRWRAGGRDVRFCTSMTCQNRT